MLIVRLLILNKVLWYFSISIFICSLVNGCFCGREAGMVKLNVWVLFLMLNVINVGFCCWMVMVKSKGMSW